MTPPPGFDAGIDGEPEINVMEYVQLVWRHRWLIVGVVVACVVLGGAWSLTRPKMYRSSSKVALQASPQTGTSQFDSFLNYWQMDRYIKDQVQVLRTRQLATRVANRLGLTDEGGAGSLLGSLQVDPVEETNIIQVSMTGLDPDKVSEYVNVYVDEYIASSIEDNLERTRQIFKVIQSRLDPLRERVTASEAQLMQFRENQDAVLFADQDKNVITEQVSKLTTEYAEAKSDRIRLETKINALRRLTASNLGVASFPEILQDETIKNLRAERGKLESELTEKLRTYKEGHPEIQDIRSRLNSIDDRLHEQISTIRDSLQTDFEIVSQREKALFNNIQQLKTQSIDLSKQTMEFEALKRDYDQNKSFLEQMLARSKEADISSTTTFNNMRVIEPAIPAGGPFSPNVPRSVAVSLILGLFLGVGLVLGIDFLDHTLRTPDQVETHVGLEVLSALPKLTDDNARVLRESFQSLRTALMLAARGEGCHIVEVTSAVPAEGKTTVAFNLAKVLATGGAKVLLIDADLRKPRIHRLLQVKNTRGLTSVVLGEREVADVIHAVQDAPNLDVITSGPLPPNPPELYGKMSFRKMLDTARATYEWVIVDSPPVASVTDPVICAQYVDMAVVVAAYGSTKRHLVREACRQLGRSGVRIAGILLNKVDVDRDHYYYSTYYSYYHYGYGDEPEVATSTSARKSAKHKRSA
jgi:capsular exopolysaccharide synthesis family protein